MKAPLRFTVAVQVAALCSALVSMVLLAASKTLDIYFIDTEGGQADGT